MTATKKLGPTLVVSFGLVALLFGGLISLSHFSGERSLRRWKEAMEAKGEKFNLKHFVPSRIPTNQDSVAKLIAALAQLQPNPVDPGYLEPMRIVSPGEARVAWRQETVLGQQRARFPWADFAAHGWPGLEISNWG